MPSGAHAKLIPQRCEGVLEYYKPQMLEKLNCYVERFGILLITVALIAGMAGCGSPSSQNLEIRTWYDLNAVRNNLRGHHILMNDLDSTTAGYEELASPTANGGKGWKPIGTGDDLFAGTFDGQGYEIRDLFSNRPDEIYVGLLGVVGEGGVVQNIGVVNADVTGYDTVGGLLGDNDGGIVSNSYATGNVTGNYSAGGLVGANAGTVSNSYSTASVAGSNMTGGLVGANAGTVGNSYSTSSVFGDDNVGGLVGENTATVSDSYSIGNVTGNTRIGGLVGRNEGTVSNSFWDTQTSGQGGSAGGTGNTTAEMQDIDTFSGAGWNIIGVASYSMRNTGYVWNIVYYVTYPFLSWQPV
jgi:hypothetical protein